MERGNMLSKAPDKYASKHTDEEAEEVADDAEPSDPTSSLRAVLASLKKPADNEYFRHPWTGRGV